jgi:hypothetical protein
VFLFEGEQAVRVFTPLAALSIAHPHPQHMLITGDYYDVDHAVFLSMKKTLLRLERLVDFPCNTTLWMRVAGAPEKITAAVHNGRLHRYYRFGENGRIAEGELAECLATGRAVTAPLSGSDKYVTVLAPVRDSLGGVVGCVEFTAAKPTSARLPPAWS